MAYSESLAERLREVIAQRRHITAKKMFGGLVFFLHGNMLVGVWKTSLIVRLGPDAAAKALKEPDVIEFEITGKPMRNWIVVEPDGLERDEQLAGWVQKAIEFVSTLPKK